MKKIFEYAVVILIGVVGIVTMMLRCESIDNNVSKEDNTIKIFA